MLDEDELTEIAQDIADEGLEDGAGEPVGAEAIAGVLACLQERGVDLTALAGGVDLESLDDELAA